MGYPRAELEEMVERWLAVNRDCEAKGDWAGLAELYTEDATYGWNVGATDEFMAVGRQEILSVALGLEMAGLEGWTYPYQHVLIDDAKGEVLGFWKQLPDAPGPHGEQREVAGFGGSWFVYAGNFRWCWQRDFMDIGNVTSLYMAMIADGTLTPGMTQRMEEAMKGRQPGHYRVGESPVGMWERPYER